MKINDPTSVDRFLNWLENKSIRSSEDMSRKFIELSSFFFFIGKTSTLLKYVDEFRKFVKNKSLKNE